MALQRGEEEALQAAALMMTGKAVDISSEMAIYAAQLSIDHKIAMAGSQSA